MPKIDSIRLVSPDCGISRIEDEVEEMRTTRTIVLALLVFGAVTVPAAAQSPATHGHRTATWTVAGAGAGFGIGLWAGLTAFDDAIDSDRKVWTSAIVGAAVGGTLGYLLTRNRRQPRTTSTTTSGGHALGDRRPGALSESDVRALASVARLRR